MSACRDFKRIEITDLRKVRPGDRLVDGFVVREVERDARMRGWWIYPHPGQGLARLVADSFFEDGGRLVIERRILRAIVGASNALAPAPCDCARCIANREGAK